MRQFSHFHANIILVITMTLLCLASPLPVQADSLPDQAVIRGVVGHAQSYSLSCESRSAVDWAAFWDVDIRERKFLANLPRSDNPDAGFVGRPTDAWGNIPPQSYGVHAAPVAALLREYGLQAESHRGLKWSEARAEIANGRPVIVWVIGQMWRGIPQRYIASGGHKTTVARFEHTMILVGYSPTEVQLVDAYSGETKTFSLRNFLVSWGALGNMAVTGQATPEEPPAELAIPQAYLPVIIDHSPGGARVDQPRASNKTYIVQRGDFLAGIARRLNVNWRKLADLNDLKPPYILYPGQKLKIP
jgi:uncharacterized protein YvpB